MSFTMVLPQPDQETRLKTEELKRISTISVLAFLLFALSLIVDGPVTILAWILSAAGLVCLVYLVVVSRSILNQVRSKSRKADTP
jgi:Na+/proline symporter